MLNKKVLGDVILFGCGKIATDFYQKFKREIKIEYALSNNVKELIFKPEEFAEYQVKRPSVKIPDFKGFIIICCSCYEQIAEQLILLGYQPFVDFIDYEVAAYLIEMKKLVLLYGFCHLRGIKDCLRNSESFNKEYVAIYYPNYLYLNAFQINRFQFLVENCSVFVYGLEVTPEAYRKNQAIMQRLNKKTMIMQLPALLFGAYFPQKERQFNNMNIYAVKCENQDYTPFSYGDWWLNQCIEKGMDADAVYSLVENTNIYDADFILKYLEDEWKRILFQEKQCDFKILEYIRSNYQKRRLFRNETHMENEVLVCYAYQIMKKLGIMHADICLEQETLLRCSQHIIYPSVAQVLGLQWDVKKEVLDVYTYSGWKQVSAYEYIKLYIEVCGDIYRLKKNYFLP